VAHVVLENIERDVGDRLDDFAVGQADGAGVREVCVGEFPPLDDDIAREFEDGIGLLSGALARIASSISAGLTPIFEAIAVCALKQ
jgi:hypothetical protein